MSKRHLILIEICSEKWCQNGYARKTTILRSQERPKEEQVPKRLPKASPKGGQREVKIAKWRPRGSWNTACIQRGSQVTQMASGGCLLRPFGARKLICSTKKKACISCCVLNIFGENAKAKYQTKCQHSVLRDFCLYVGWVKRRHSRDLSQAAADTPLRWA